MHVAGDKDPSCEAAVFVWLCTGVMLDAVCGSTAAEHWGKCLGHLDVIQQKVLA